MRSGVDAAVEHARLAAEDLASAAGEVIWWGTLKPETAEDDIDFAMLSRRWTSGISPQLLEDASNDLDCATGARSEVDSIVTSGAASPGDGSASSDDRQLGDRLQAIAAECERRTAALRAGGGG